MSKKVLIIASSPRRNGNSNRLAEAFAKGAVQAGHQVDTVYLCEKNIGFCRGCLTCQQTLRCVIRDDADTIAQQMGAADVLVFATPIYYYGMSGQMKTMLDRANPLFPSDYAFRDVYLLTAAAEDDPETPEGAVHGLQGWISCFENARLAGSVFAGGVTNAGEIEGHPALQTAFEMGSRI